MNGGSLLRQLDWIADKLRWGERVTDSDWDRRYYRTLYHAVERRHPIIKEAIRNSMLQEEFDNFKMEFFNDQNDLLTLKGHDYTGGGDRLANFKEEGEALGVTPLQVWATFAGKHWRALCTFVRDGSLRSESVRSRFLDLANYALLGAALAAEEEQLVPLPEEDAPVTVERAELPKEEPPAPAPVPPEEFENPEMASAFDAYAAHATPAPTDLLRDAE